MVSLFFLNLHSPWHALGLVDTAVYGAPHSGLTRRQVCRILVLFVSLVHIVKYLPCPNFDAGT